MLRQKKETHLTPDKAYQIILEQMAMKSFRKVVATALSTDFRKACEVISTNTLSPVGSEVLVKTRFAGVNATDINFSAGRYSADGSPDLPMDVGLEGIGEIVEVGKDVPFDMVGQPVGYMVNGSYAEYMRIPVRSCFPLPGIKKEYVGLLVSGLTASIALEEFGRLSTGEKVLVTAAAGGTGHIAVQLAKLQGCHVIGTCSSQEKTDMLKSLGCDHVINYKEEDLSTELKKHYPKGIDVVYESVGGPTFEACVNRLAPRGRMIVLGYITSYQSPAGIDRHHRNATLMTKLLMKSGTVSGFFLFNHIKQVKPHLSKLVSLLNDGKLKIEIDDSDASGKPFIGVESAFDAVDYLYSRQSKGKVVIQTNKNNGSRL